MTAGEGPLDFTPLKRYGMIFRIFRMARRARMILVRLFLVFIFLIILSLLFDVRPVSYGFSYSSSNSSIRLDLILLLVIVLPVIFFVVRWQYMDTMWRAFAARNNFKIMIESNYAARAVEMIPSFKGKMISFPSGVITGKYRSLSFAFFTRQYKEGGVLRWRERHMDTILTLFMPGQLPHIVINARDNERARRSNLSASFPDSHKFHFEGVYGGKYDVYTHPASRVTALQLFTPDVLAVLYERLPHADIEMKGNKLWIVQRYGILDDRLAESLFEAGSQLYIELQKQMKSARLLDKVDQTAETAAHA